mgnify:CR=1 FL=1
MAERVNTECFREKVLEADIPVIADFYSDSCVPCKKLSPVLSKIEREYEGKLSVVKINVLYDGELAESYGLESTPSLLFFSNGEVKGKLVGAVSQEEIETVIGEIL